MQSLRAVLQKLEKNFSSLEDQPMFAELRRLILLHIADLESVGGAVEKANAEGGRGIKTQFVYASLKIPPRSCLNWL